MRLPIQYLPHYNRAAWGELAYAHAGDAGFDLKAAIAAPVFIGFGEVVIVPAGVAMAVPEGHEVQIRPRSGLAAKLGLTVVNAPGTIDAGYRGEIQVILSCLKREGAEIRPGDRLAQAVLAPVLRAELAAVTSLDETARGTGGLGSTGV
jgi:dUTP pyrophosphatase